MENVSKDGSTNKEKMVCPYSGQTGPTGPTKALRAYPENCKRNIECIGVNCAILQVRLIKV